MKPIFLCAINNILSGTCQEDCKFCTQSVRYHADIPRYSYKNIETIVNEAKQAKANGALGYCLVTAGKGLDEKKTKFVCEAATSIKEQVPDLNLIACNGTASRHQLQQLKDAGIDSYNHNLETSKRYYPEICQMHSWDERHETCQNVNDVGLKLCCGGIFGMGENLCDQDELLLAIASLNPASVPLNFYHPNPALPLKTSSIDYESALTLITKARKMLGDSPMLMVAGGRELLFDGKEREMFQAGANSIVIGNYLTTDGAPAKKDLEMIKSLGYTIATSCEE